MNKLTLSLAEKKEIILALEFKSVCLSQLTPAAPDTKLRGLAFRLRGSLPKSDQMHTRSFSKPDYPQNLLDDSDIPF